MRQGFQGLICLADVIASTEAKPLLSFGSIAGISVLNGPVIRCGSTKRPRMSFDDRSRNEGVI